MKAIGSYPNTRLRRNRKTEWSRRLVQENNAENFANPVGEENELEDDWSGVLDHIDRDIPDEDESDDEEDDSSP